MRSRRNSIYVDDAPAGDPTYDPHGTSRPFRPTHRTHAPRQAARRTSYLEIEKRTTPSKAEHPVTKVLSALRQTIQYKFEDSNPFEKVRRVGYGAAGLVGAFCVLVIGISTLAKLFPMADKDVPVTAETAAATATTAATTDGEGNSVSSKIGTGTPTSDSELLGAPANVDGQPGMPMVDGIADSTMLLYVKAAQTCGMPWHVLAAVGRVETNHGTSNAAGVNEGQNFAGAKGPMQFMQGTWDKYGLDANRDGKRDIYDQTDAVYSAAGYLCANGAGSGNIDNALWHYNHSSAYVDLVKQTAESYLDSSYRLPLPAEAATNAQLGEAHHDYPAADIPVAQGTPVFAVHKGTVRTVRNSQCGAGVEIQGTDGVKYTYCHASAVLVNTGDVVNAGKLLMRSGGTPGTDGAGDSTGPHLHFEMNVNGTNVCPQSMLQNWAAGKFFAPTKAPASGCSY